MIEIKELTILCNLFFTNSKLKFKLKYHNQTESGMSGGPVSMWTFSPEDVNPRMALVGVHNGFDRKSKESLISPHLFMITSAADQAAWVGDSIGMVSSFKYQGHTGADYAV